MFSSTKFLQRTISDLLKIHIFTKILAHPEFFFQLYLRSGEYDLRKTKESPTKNLS